MNGDAIMAFSKQGSTSSSNGYIDNEFNWVIFGRRVPKSAMVFFSQIILIYIVVITCIINLSMDNGNTSLWITLLSASTGYLLPNPSLKRGPPHALHTSSSATVQPSSSAEHSLN